MRVNFSPLTRTLCSNRRYQSTTSQAPAGVSAWIDKVTSVPPVFSTDWIDPQRVRHLQRTLPTRVGSGQLQSHPAEPAHHLPKAHHLILFQPQTPLDELGADGSSTEYNAPAPYLRRMWAGGSFEWNVDPQKQLRVGELVTESSKIAKVDWKHDKLFVYQEKHFYAGDHHAAGKDLDGWAVKETRTHVFRTDDTVKGQKQPSRADSVSLDSDLTFTYTPTSPLLFRYSALTYNGHKIHYDRHWAQEVEGHPDLVVHGPLTATLLVELAVKMGLDKRRTIQTFEYRATSPIYVDREVKLSGRWDGEDARLELWAEHDGRVCMKAKASF